MKPLPTIFLFLLTIKAFAQDPDPYKILEKVREIYLGINDYTAKVRINVNVDFIHIPQKEAEVFFKAPDKYRYKSEGFIMIPKKGIDFSIVELMSKPFDAIYAGEVTENGINYHKIKMIPAESTEDLILATLQIEKSTWYIGRVEATTKKSGSFTIDLYQHQGVLPLPDSIRITFEVGKLRFPLKFMGNVKFDTPAGETPDHASVTMKYYDYQVNAGISDEIFKEQPVEE